MEAIILAGGLGTRLRSMVSEVPKPMAPVADKPFLKYILDYLNENNFKRAILAVGYKWEVIKNYFGDKYKNLELVYSNENQPLGTGGAIKQASQLCNRNEIFVFNGDTFFDVDIKEFLKFHNSKNSFISIASKPLTNFERYGTIKLNQNSEVVEFIEKQFVKKGNINGGVYIINKKIFDNETKAKFSFETDILNKLTSKGKMFAKVFDSYFIDIGIPEDYIKAQEWFKKL